MATKVKPSRIQITGTPQAGDVPMYVSEDCFCWGAGGGGGCAEWGCITGTLCDQTDLQGALNCKADCSAIPTDNCQLANSCGYVTSAAIPTDNCQLANGCGYTTCTGTLSSCSDVISTLGYTPYNCTNPAGYTTCTGTISTCSQIISALGYTPYNSTNPSGYTSCTGTLTAETVVSGDTGCTYTIKVSASEPGAGTPSTTITFVTA